MDERTESLKSLVEVTEGEPPLDRALLLIAEGEEPDLDIDYYLGELDWLAEEVQRTMRSADPVAALRKTLFGVAGFKGNDKDYHNPKNSLIHRVLDRRLGIPISLCSVYIEVARRLDIDVEGVGFPGHFIVRHREEDKELLVDPFSGGVRVEREDCGRILNRLTGRDTELEPWMFSPSTNNAIISRILSNLHRAYVLKRDLLSAINALERILVVDPSRDDAVRDRALLYVDLGCYPAAVDDLEAYLVRRPDCSEERQLKRLVARLRKKQLVYN